MLKIKSLWKLMFSKQNLFDQPENQMKTHTISLPQEKPSGALVKSNQVSSIPEKTAESKKKSSKSSVPYRSKIKNSRIRLR